jgi:hypothetical protein
VDIPDDTIAACYQLKYQGCNVETIFVVRWFESKGREVWVWRSLTVCSKECKHVMTDETGWSVLEPMPSAVELRARARRRNMLFHRSLLRRAIFSVVECFEDIHLHSSSG